VTEVIGLKRRLSQYQAELGASDLGQEALIGGEKSGASMPPVRTVFVRQPAVAGTFYPSDPAQCAAMAAGLLRAGLEHQMPVTSTAGGAGSIGAIVPHAGWVCSGAIAGHSIAAVAGLAPGANAGIAAWRPDVVVVFGAIHTPIAASAGMLCSADAWAEPGGSSPVQGELNAKLKERSGLFVVDDRFHQREHAVEVELPLIQSAWPGVSILPVEVPLTDAAAEMGRFTARQVTAAGRKAVFLASSDLTHYGPSYRFAPAGVGPEGLAWARDNDRRLLDLVAGMAANRIVPHVREHANACGGGAIAAMLAACLECGATTARVLRHTNSFEALAAVAPQPPIDAVGYAAVIVG
jgi:AmmeMemoRadiSam system protein B